MAELPQPWRTYLQQTTVLQVESSPTVLIAHEHNLDLSSLELSSMLMGHVRKVYPDTQNLIIISSLTMKALQGDNLSISQVLL